MGLTDRSAPHRISFGTVLTVAMMAGTFPGYVFGVFGPQLIDEFDLTRVQLGLLTAVFFLVGGTLSLSAGHAVDRYGARRVMLTSFALVAAALVAIAAAGSYAVLLAAAAGAGLALATGNPVTNKLIATHVGVGRRGLIMGSKQAGVQLGAFLAGAILVPVAVQIGWREALIWCASAPLVAFVITMRTVPSDRLTETADRGGSHPRMGSGLRRLALYAFLMGGGIASVNTYLPLYLVERAGASAAEAGFAVAVVGLVGIVGRVILGVWSERVSSYPRTLTVLAVGAVTAVLMLAIAAQLGLWIAFVAAALIGATAMTWNSVGMLAVLSLSGAGNAGRASGIVLFGFYIGFVASPVLFGYLVDWLGNYGWAWLLVAALFGLAAAVGAEMASSMRAERQVSGSRLLQ